MKRTVPDHTNPKRKSVSQKTGFSAPQEGFEFFILKLEDKEGIKILLREGGLTMNTRIKYPEWMINPYLRCVYCYLANFEGAKVNENSIVIHTDSHLAAANFYDYQKTGILELSVENTQTGENEFYLHMEPVDPDDTFQAALSFMDVVKAKSKTINDLEQVITGCKRVLLVCTSGVTSGLFAQMMQKILDENGSSTKVESAAFSQLDKICLSCYDKILLTPQVGYHLQDITRHFGKKVAKINTLDFATMNARKVIHDLL